MNFKQFILESDTMVAMEPHTIHHQPNQQELKRMPPHELAQWFKKIRNIEIKSRFDDKHGDKGQIVGVQIVSDDLLLKTQVQSKKWNLNGYEHSFFVRELLMKNKLRMNGNNRWLLLSY